MLSAYIIHYVPNKLLTIYVNVTCVLYKALPILYQFSEL